MRVTVATYTAKAPNICVHDIRMSLQLLPVYCFMVRLILVAFEKIKRLQSLSKSFITYIISISSKINNICITIILYIYANLRPSGRFLLPILPWGGDANIFYGKRTQGVWAADEGQTGIWPLWQQGSRSGWGLPDLPVISPRMEGPLLWISGVPLRARTQYRESKPWRRRNEGKQTIPGKTKEGGQMTTHI